MKSSRIAVLLLLGVAVLPGPAAAERVGVVTAAHGDVTLARATGRPVPLKFREDILLNDRISTGEQALARILFGGKAVVTVAERSVLTVTDAASASVIDVRTGRLALAVVHDRMRPGESIDIRTPYAVAGVRGTVVVAEVVPSATAAGELVSRFTVLKGVVDVTVDAGRGARVARRLPLGRHESIEIDEHGHVRRSVVSEAAAQRLAATFSVAPARQPVRTSAVTDEHIREAVEQSVAVAKRYGDRREPGERDGRGRDAATSGPVKSLTPTDALKWLTDTDTLDAVNRSLENARGLGKPDRPKIP